MLLESAEPSEIPVSCVSEGNSNADHQTSRKCLDQMVLTFLVIQRRPSKLSEPTRTSEISQTGTKLGGSLRTPTTRHNPFPPCLTNRQ